MLESRGENSMSELTDKTVRIPDVEPGVMKELCTYMYTGVPRLSISFHSALANTPHVYNLNYLSIHPSIWLRTVCTSRCLFPNSLATYCLLSLAFFLPLFFLLSVLMPVDYFVTLLCLLLCFVYPLSLTITSFFLRLAITTSLPFSLFVLNHNRALPKYLLTT